MRKGQKAHGRFVCMTGPAESPEVFGVRDLDALILAPWRAPRVPACAHVRMTTSHCPISIHMEVS